jgi:polyhydroxyalkanoate synthesis regulator protein
MHDYTENNLVRLRRQLSFFYGEDNLVMMTDQLNQNMKPTNKQKRLIKSSKKFKVKNTKNNLVRLRRQLRYDDRST